MYSVDVTARINAALAILPPYYASSKVAEAILGSKAIELETIHINNNDLLDQLFVPTATWGLDYWERDLLIETVLTDSYEVRRGRVGAKLIGQSKFSSTSIQDVCTVYEVGEISVNVIPYTVTITFIGTRGIPSSLDSITADVNELIDAHLEVVYEFTYTSWDEWDTWDFTHDELDALDLTYDEKEIYIP